MIFGFGDMLFAVYAVYRNRKDLDVCHKENMSPFCSSNRSDGYIVVYELFVGSVNSDDFNANFLSMVLFVAVTFFGVIILLNMLIALVNKSYEKSLLSSNKLFGKTRVALVAKNILLEEMFRSKSCLSVIVKLCFVLGFIYIVVLPIGFANYYLSNSEEFENLTAAEKAIYCLILFVCIVNVFLLLYFSTLVLVHYFKVIRFIATHTYFLRLVEGTFQCFFVAPATYLTLFLLDARGPYVLSEDPDVTAASGTKPNSTRRQRSTTNDQHVT
jgi:hypothetical protein